MGPDERDRIFDKALSRHLRASQGAADAALQRGSCPDAETLAAYHERSLLPEELNSWKEHIVDCAHCQVILAQLESTDQIPLEAADKEEALAMKESVAAMATQNLETLPAAAAPGKSQAAAETRLREKARPSRLSSRWRWLAPAGALAAGLLVWIAVHENEKPHLPALPTTQIAKNQEPPASAPSSSGPVSATLPPVPSDLAKSKSATNETASSNARTEWEAIRRTRKLDYEAPGAPEKPFADKEKGLRKDAARDSNEELLRAGNQADLDAKAVPRAMQQEVAPQAQTEAANIQSQNQNNYNAQKVPGPAPLSQMDTKKKEQKTARAAAAAAPEPSSAGVAGLTAATSMMQAVTVSNPGLISPPGSTVVWRAGRAGLIEFSSDNGASWSRQTSGVLVDLLAGSAPSDKVCWMVGRVGAVLLTTDGGAHWKSIAAPLSEDLGFVHALDALHATIWNARNTKSFETRDGGLTWQRVAHP